MSTILPRTGWAALLALSSLIAGRTQGCVAAARAETLPAVRAVGCIGITVSAAGAAEAFYARVLSFAESQRRVGLDATTVRMRLGRECIELTEHPSGAGRAIPADARSNDRFFQHIAIVVSDMDRAYAVLTAAHVEAASVAPQRLPDWNPNAGGIRAFYFRDPDRHVLEVIQFPPGKGDRRWQGKGALFLGIDHTAIVVADTEASLRFYRDALGFRVAGESENWGIEQERLNNVPGAHLRITTLRAAAGPGVELLEYLTPRDGRPYPADARADDLIHWQTALLVDRFAGLLRDPDGHALFLGRSEW